MIERACGHATGRKRLQRGVSSSVTVTRVPPARDPAGGERPVNHVRLQRPPAHPPDDPQLLRVAPLERELLVGQREAAGARAGHEPGPRGRPVLDGRGYWTGSAPSARLVRSVSDTWRHTSSGGAASSTALVIAIGRVSV